MDIQRHELQQFLIAHFREQEIGGPFKNIFGHLLLGLDQLVDLFFKSTSTDKLMYQYVFRLPDPECTVGGLVLDSWIPPSVKVDYVRSGGQIQTRPPCFQR